jgi:glycosyltransferase involved in cell wall biosynthesis
MFVSVVLCTFNGARFLEEQVESILQQTYPITELIISDDASTDTTPAIIERMAMRDSRIRFIQLKKNIGFSANFQQAMERANSELIATADQDDVWHPEKIARLVAALAPDASLIYCDSVKFTQSIPIDPRPSLKNKKIEGSDPRMLSVFNTVSGHAMLIRKKLLETAFPLPEGVYYDWWLAVVAMSNDRVQFLPDILVYRRVHDRNVTLPIHLSAAQQRHAFRITLVQHLKAFSQLSTLSAEQADFFHQGYTYWKDSLYRKMNKELFCWLMSNREVIYCNKIRTIPLISQLKNSWQFSFRWELLEGS